MDEDVGHVGKSAFQQDGTLYPDDVAYLLLAPGQEVPPYDGVDDAIHLPLVILALEEILGQHGFLQVSFCIVYLLSYKLREALAYLCRLLIETFGLAVAVVDRDAISSGEQMAQEALATPNATGDANYSHLLSSKSVGWSGVTLVISSMRKSTCWGEMKALDTLPGILMI